MYKITTPSDFEVSGIILQATPYSLGVYRIAVLFTSEKVSKDIKNYVRSNSRTTLNQVKMNLGLSDYQNIQEIRPTSNNGMWRRRVVLSV